MNRTQLEHVLRAASQIAGEPDVLVIGSPSILGGLPEDRLPIEAISSIKVDVTFFDDPDDAKSDLVDGVLGEFRRPSAAGAAAVSSSATIGAGWRCYAVVHVVADKRALP